MSDFSSEIRFAIEPYHIIGEICPECKKETVWHPMYVGMAAPNRLCKSCGKIWVTDPKKIEIKGEVDE